jgi:hypothetical protein
VLDATAGRCLMINQGGEVDCGALMLTARTEQIRVGTGSIKTLAQRRDAAGNQLHLHAVQS